MKLERLKNLSRYIYSTINILLCREILLRLKNWNKNSYVIMFHNVENIKNKKDRYSITKEELEEYILHLQSTGKKIANNIEECFLDRNKVFITFDDGYKSIKNIVLPIMLKHNIPFTIFIVVDYIGKDGYLTKEDLILLKKSGICKIGSHSISHPIFSELSIQEKKRELLESRDKLEKILNFKVEDFAFPYGSSFPVDKISKKLSKEIYKNVFLTTPLCLKKESKYIPRIDIKFYLRRKNDKTSNSSYRI